MIFKTKTAPYVWYKARFLCGRLPIRCVFVSELLVESFESLLELINASACINKLLLAGEEGVALGANFDSDLASLCGLCNYGLAACALDNALFVLGLNCFFHFSLPHKIISLLFGSDFTSRVIISLFFAVVNSFLKIYIRSDIFSLLIGNDRCICGFSLSDNVKSYNSYYGGDQYSRVHQDIDVCERVYVVRYPEDGVDRREDAVI